MVQPFAILFLRTVNSKVKYFHAGNDAYSTLNSVVPFNAI